MKKIRCRIKYFVLFALPFLLLACAPPTKPSPRRPVTLTVWHSMVEQMKGEMDRLVEEFNQTIGVKEGIVVNITSVANTAMLHEKIMAAVEGVAGTPELPDMAVLYPNVAVSLAEKGLLADFSPKSARGAASFSARELARFVPEFLEEGRLGGDTLYLLPVAKSTEVLYVNTVMFDRFAAAVGASLDDLATFEGLLELADKYYNWTNRETPDIPNDGKIFFYIEPLFNFLMVGVEQLGDRLVEDRTLNLDTETFKKVWETWYYPAVKGEGAVFDGYGNYLAMTGEIVCSISTSAGALFYPQTVNYLDNTIEEAKWAVLPYPVFANGEKVVMQRGGGMAVIKSTPVREYAAMMFLRWFTDPAQNMRFAAASGYMPVHSEAFEQFLSGGAVVGNETVQNMFRTVTAMTKDYRFFIPPVFDSFDSIQTTVSKNMRAAAVSSQKVYINELKNRGQKNTFTKLVAEDFQELVRWNHERAASQ